MTDAQPSVLTQRCGHVLVITPDRPQSRDAVDADLAGRLADALEGADADRPFLERREPSWSAS